MADAIRSKTEVKAYVKATIDATPSFNGGTVKTLDGKGRGLKDLSVGVERDISEEEGYFEGFPDNVDTLTQNGSQSLKVRLDNEGTSDMTWLLGKWGQYLHLQRAFKNAAGTTIATDVSVGIIKKCDIVENGKLFDIEVETMLESFSVS